MVEPLAKTAWVAPAYEAGGLDHLGVKGPIMHIYSELLPGITNVTNRLRYYSFYTWLIWRLEQRGERNVEALRQAARKGDCLFTLIAEYHGLGFPGERSTHSAATVGNDTLSSIAQQINEGTVARLSTYASEQPSKNRYFKNRLGGLGQYYLGSLRDLYLLSGDGNSGIKFTIERGRPLAEAFDRCVDGERFWRCIDQDSVDSRDLAALAGFCPCQLKESADERLLLSEILFALDEHSHKEKGPARRMTLQLMLNLASHLGEQNQQFDIRSFRNALYGGTLPDGGVWPAPKFLLSIQQRWAVYVSNEILSLGLQGLFHAILSARLKSQSQTRVVSASDMAAWYFEQGPGLDIARSLGQTTLSELLHQTALSLPNINATNSASHELALANRINDSYYALKDDTSIADFTQLCLNTLLALGARLQHSSEPYGQLTFPPGYFNYFPLNLRSYQKHHRELWQTATAMEWVKELVTEWCINAHIRVALRKLRAQSTATFQVRPTDNGLWVVGAPEPQFSSPRFYQARQILADLGAVEHAGNEVYTITSLGQRLMEARND